MGFEDMAEVTKTGKKSAKKESSKKSNPSAAHADTYLEQPGMERTLSVENKTSESQPKERVSIDPKSEKEEFLERFGMYDEPEELEAQKEIRAQIKAEPEAPAHFLEKEVSDEKKQERFLEDLVIRLQETVGVNIDRDEVNEIIDGDKNIYDKIKTLLVISRAKNFEDLQMRRDIFEEIHNFLDAKYKKDRRQILNELADADADQEEKNRLAAQILNPLEQNYRTKLTDFKNEHLGLNLQLSKDEREELDILEDKEPEELSKDESKKLKKIREKIRIIQELEEI